jgi:Na+:H+ antiporter, NhaA family
MTLKPSNLKEITTVIQSSFQEFFSRSSSAGIVILIATAIAMLWVNSPFGSTYDDLVHQHGVFSFMGIEVAFTFEKFVNDGLMVIFFLLVGLEIKREIMIGELSSRRKAALPLVAAAFGMIVPGLIFAAYNWGTPEIRGWGIPVATDIAFALGILALLGSRVPMGLKVFLAALAIVDDLLAVLIIAVFYTADLNMMALGAAGLILVILYGGNQLGVHTTRFYAFFGFLLWIAVLYSGVHATIAGVLLAMTIPVQARLDPISFTKKARSLIDRISKAVETEEDEGKRMDMVNALEDISEGVQSPLSRMEHGLSFYVSFLIMPIFALANAGVHIRPELLGELLSPVGLGIALGLFVGKLTGVTLSVYGAVKLKIAELPRNVTMKQIFGVAALCGIGFTMALFVANLAYSGSEALNISKLSVLLGSTVSAVVGSIYLRMWLPRPQRSM